jgi:hypothetical protein
MRSAKAFAWFAWAALLLALPAFGQTNQPLNRAQSVRWDCIQSRRIICGKIVKVLPEGIVVDSGYANLDKFPLNHPWLLPGTMKAQPASNLIEANETDSICVGLVFLCDLPRKPIAKLYDYVHVEGYPVDHCAYTSVGNVKRTIRRFSLKLERAVQRKLDENG